ncbi:DUF4384 domain-containing protein [bacterium]|nr:DUF4384 domain-containing protein [bacterium]
MNNNQCPSSFALELYVLENTGDETLKDHIASCAHCQEQIASIRNEQKAFLVTHPFEPFYEKITTPSSSRRKSGSIFDFFSLPSFRWASGLVMAMLALFILKPVLFESKGVRFKGEPVIGYYIKEGTEAVLGKPGDLVSPGNQIRFYVNPGTYTHVVVLGVESDGTINRYYPDKGDTNIPIPQNTPYFFPDSIVLDTSPHNELIIAVFGDADLSYASVEQKLKNIPGLYDSIKKKETPALNKLGLVTSSLILNKGE